jgi:hypothetical protein
LTLRSTDAPLRDELDRLYNAFKRLRSSRWWKGLVLGGVAFLELTYNDKRRQWHPHLHLIVQGRYVPHADLSREWHKRTGDSFIVDVRAVRSNDEVTSYVTKYVSKTAVPDTHLADRLLDEWCEALESRKLCLCWGSFRAFRLLQRKPSDGSWETIGSLHGMLDRIDAGDDYTYALLERAFPQLTAAYFGARASCPDTS